MEVTLLALMLRETALASLMLRIRKVPGSNLGPETGYPD
jgi:hypothetical protein